MKGRCREYTVDEVQSFIDGIVAYKLSETGSGSAQDWINGDLTEGAGSWSEWYIIALSQSGQYDLSSYENGLRAYIRYNNVPSATSREKYALALAASGSTDRYIAEVLDSSIGQQGIMSWIYGLHIINNGYTSDFFDADKVIDSLLSMQLGDGGWALFGANGDIDVTAMTMQAMAPYYGSRDDVRSAVDRGIDFLSERQNDDGGFASFGTANSESTAQVLVTVSALGIDCLSDERLIKNGCTLIDGLLKYRLPDGSFCHTLDGYQNESATMQALYSLVAYKRYRDGRGPLLIMDNRRALDAPSPEQPSVQPAQPQQPGGSVSIQPDTPAVTTPSAPGTVSPTATAAVSGTVTTGNAASQTTTVSGRTSTTISAVSGTSGFTVTMSVTIVSGTGSDTSVTSVAVTALTTSASKGGGNSSYKVKAIIIILISAVLLSLILFATGKRNYKNFIAVAIVAAAAAAAVLFTDIKTKDEYYNGEKKSKPNAVGTVTLTIRCDTIAGKSDSEFIPEDGIILDTTDFDIDEGETVFDILTEAARAYGIQVENTGSKGNSHGMVYIAGINYIYEKDFGDLSGWVYHVNGISPSRNCGEYVLSDGDQIEWLYTCELGYDLNEVYEE